MLQIGLDVKIAGGDLDSKYVCKFRMYVHVWTRGDEQSDERLQFTNRAKEVLSVGLGALVLGGNTNNQ